MKNLAIYVERQNSWNKIFKKPQIDLATLTQAQAQVLYDSLQCELSPENLCCDGELSGTALQRKAALLNGAVKDLKKLGFQLNEYAY